jgi:hypothetical protein
VLPSGEAIADAVLDLLGVSGGHELRRAEGAVVRTSSMPALSRHTAFIGMRRR